MLEVLLSRPDAMAMARRAAEQGDEAAMRKFVKERWDKCIDLGVAHLLNDLAYVPSGEIATVECVSATSQHVWTSAHSNREVIAADELMSTDKVLAVRNAPAESGDHPEFDW